jgi:SpoVK/Ycf46/Vps4 family AAA+-type ATPase
MCFLHALLGVLDFDNAEYGLLNCSDGPTSKNDRTFCMTSTLDRLDHAPVRPGRCDQKVHFGYASEEICIKLFEHLYTKTPDELLESRRGDPSSM